MNSESVTLEQALALAKQLTPLEKVHLIEKMMPALEAELQASSDNTATTKRPLRSVYGLCADLGEAPTAEAMDESRQEFLENFPREDV